MTLIELQQSIRDLILAECEKMELVNVDKGQPENCVSLNSQAIEYLTSIDDFTKWQYVPSSSKTNIAINFLQRKDSGNYIGFIDGGIIFKKGKVGIVFHQNGLFQRSMGDTYCREITYKTVCGAVIKSGDYLIAQNKFDRKSDVIPIVEASPNIQRILRNIRDILLSSDAAAKAEFWDHYVILIEKLKTALNESSEANISKTFGLLKDYTESNSQNGYVSPKSIQLLLQVYNFDFNGARSVLSDGTDEWKTYIDDTEKRYFRVMSDESYEKAQKLSADRQYSEALKFAKKAISYAADDGNNWLLLTDIICNSANEDNSYLWEDIQDLLEKSKDPSSAQANAVLAYKERLDAVISERDAVVSQIGIFAEKDDLTLFEQHPFVINTYDKYHMNPLMYAALYRQKGLFHYLLSKTASPKEKNIIGLDCLDLCVLVSAEISQYNAVVGELDRWYIEKQETNEFNRKMNNVIRGADSVMGSVLENGANSFRSKGQLDKAEEAKAYAQDMKYKAEDMKDRTDSARSECEEAMAERFSSHKEKSARILENYLKYASHGGEKSEEIKFAKKIKDLSQKGA